MRSLLLGAAIICSATMAAKSDGISNTLAQNLLIGHWTGESANSTGPFQFHTMNCANGRFAVAVIQAKKDTFIYFGSWKTDGATMTHKSEVSGTFGGKSLDMRSIKSDSFENLYHIVELTKSSMIYEWRGELTRRFEAQRDRRSSEISTEELNRLACTSIPTLS